MAESKKYYWLKLKEDFFDDDTIQWIEEQPNGEKYSLFYLKLCLKSLKSDGVLIRNVGDMLIPYDTRKISELTRTDIDTVRVSMDLFKNLGLIQILENGEIFLTQLENMVGSESKWAKYKQNKQLKAAEPEFKYIKKISYEQLQLPNGKIQYVDNKRYGGNAFIAFENAQGKCQRCGTYENLCIHHMNGYSNDLKDLAVLCRKCHREIELGTSPTEIGDFPTEVQLDSNDCPKKLQTEIEKEIENRDRDKEIDIQAIELCKYYEELKPGQSITKDIATLKIFLEDYEYDWCKEALQKTVMGTGKFVTNYMGKILKDWAANGKPDAKKGDKDDGDSGQNNESSPYDFSKFGG